MAKSASLAYLKAYSEDVNTKKLLEKAVSFCIPYTRGEAPDFQILKQCGIAAETKMKWSKKLSISLSKR